MKARATMLSVLLLGASWVAAQSASPDSTPQTGSSSSQVTQGSQSSVSNPSSPNSSAPSQTAPDQSMSDKGVSKAAANQTSLRGCLAGSPTSGEYTLTDQQTGMVYHLSGNIADLRMHVGEQVEVMGDSMNKSNSADAGSSGASGTANAGSAGANASTGAISSSQAGNAGSM